MQSVQLYGYGQSAQIEEIAKPEPGEGEVLVRIEACALNPLDILVASGSAQRFFDVQFPFTPATDIAGTVEAVGGGISALAVDDRVIGWLAAPAGGGLADYAVVPASCCVTLPEGLTMEQGAGIPTAGSTAFHALFSVGRLKAGERVLIHAGAGGVGSFAVQFAHAAGAQIVATASGDGVAFVRDLGADTVIDYREEDFAAKTGPVDLVLDLVGGNAQTRSLDLLSEGGRLVTVVAPPNAETVKRRGIETTMFLANAYHDRLSEVVDAVAAHGVAVPIHARVPLALFEEAWEMQAGRRARGKVIVVPAG